MEHVKTFNNDIFHSKETKIYQDDDGKYYFENGNPILSNFDIKYHNDHSFYIPLDFILSVADFDTVLQHPLYCPLYLAQFGTDEDRKQLRQHKFWRVRAAVAQFGTSEDRLALCKDNHPFVLYSVIDSIIVGGAQSHEIICKSRNKLIYLAKFGSNKDRWLLIHDSSPDVIEAILKHGNKQQREFLFKHNKYALPILLPYLSQKRLVSLLQSENVFFLIKVIPFIKNKKHLEPLVYHPDEYVREAIAEHGTDEQRDILMKDKSDRVLIALAEYSSWKLRYILWQKILDIALYSKKPDINIDYILPHIADEICKKLQFDKDCCSEEILKHRNYFIKQFLKAPYSSVNKALAQYGDDYCRDLLLQHYRENNFSLNDYKQVVRTIARRGTAKQRQYIMDNSSFSLSSKNRNYSLAGIVSQFGTNEERQKLLDIGTSDYNLRLIAEYGSHKHRQYLLEQELSKKLPASAKKNPEKYFSKNRNYILENIVQYGTDEHRSQLINYPDPYIRKCIAMCSSQDHIKLLLNDENEDVRAEAMKHFRGESASPCNTQAITSNSSEKTKEI